MPSGKISFSSACKTASFHISVIRVSPPEELCGHVPTGRLVGNVACISSRLHRSINRVWALSSAGVCVSPSPLIPSLVMGHGAGAPCSLIALDLARKARESICQLPSGLPAAHIESAHGGQNRREHLLTDRLTISTACRMDSLCIPIKSDVSARVAGRKCESMYSLTS